jgi:SAM-dependent methyltransferase
MKPDYYPDELAQAGPEHLDAAYVAAYEAKSQFDPSADVNTLLQQGLDSSSTLLDFGGGTGVFVTAMAPHVKRVVAIDISPAMLTVLRQRVAKAGLTNVECVQAGFLTYDNGTELVDAIYTRNALHHLPDFWKVAALRRMVDMLRPGGVLLLRDLIYDFVPSETDEVIERWLSGAVTDPARGYTRADLTEHVRTEHSTFRWLLEPMIDAAGLEILDVEFRRSVYGRYVCRKR